MIVLAGEALVDLAPHDGALLPLPGGSPYNVALGVGRLGGHAAFLGGLSRDGFGRRLAGRLRDDGVDLGLALTTDAPTTLAVVHLDDDARASYGFYLESTSALTLTADNLPPLPDDAALHVSLGAITLQTEPTGHALAALLRREHDRRLVSLDPNVRPSMITDIAGYATRVDQAVAGVNLVKASIEDLELLHPTRDPVEVARGWASAGPALVVITRGEEGAIALRRDAATIEVPGESVDVVDTVGAGDAFTAGLLRWLDTRGALDTEALVRLTDDQMHAALRRATQVAAIACQRAGADPPRADELPS